MTMTVHNYRPRQFHRTSNGENPSSGYRYMGSTSLAADRLTARLPEPWRQYPSSPEGWGVKTVCSNKTYFVEIIYFCHFENTMYKKRFFGKSPQVFYNFTHVFRKYSIFTAYFSDICYNIQDEFLCNHNGSGWLCLIREPTITLCKQMRSGLVCLQSLQTGIHQTRSDWFMNATVKKFCDLSEWWALLYAKKII